MDNKLTTKETTTISIPQDQYDFYKSLAEEGPAGSFISREDDGLKVNGSTYAELFVQVVNVERYGYAWDGTNKRTEHGLTEQEMKDKGLKPGANLTVRILRPEIEGMYVLSLPVSSFGNFKQLTRDLVFKGLMPPQVILKLRVTMKKFKSGHTAGVIIFEPVKIIEPDQESPLNVTPEAEGNQTPQPSSKAQEPINRQIPAEWS